jgi:hypothetical protein
MKFILNFISSLKEFKVVITIFTSLILFYLSSTHYTDVHQIAIKRNLITGYTEIDSVPGFNITSPFTLVIKIDTRPQRICVTSSSRNFNCLLVSFNGHGWREFVELEGVYYYWWANRISFNMGYDDEYRGMRDIIRGYSFDKTPRSFINVEKELSD